MKIRRLTFVALALVAVLPAAGCGGGAKDAARKACGEVLPALSGAPALPKGFPAVDSVIYTKSGGIHGIENPNDQPLRFVAFLYHSA